MTLKERINDLMKSSMKSGDKATLAAVRMLHAAVRKKEIDDRIDLDDAGVAKIVQSLVKQRQDAIEQFKAGNRQDLVDKETAELNLLLTFLPQQLSEAELRTFVDSAVKEANATTAKDIGAVMKVLMPKVSGRADGKLLNQLVRERLQ